jgi:hypothetical protein
MNNIRFVGLDTLHSPVAHVLSSLRRVVSGTIGSAPPADASDFVFKKCVHVSAKRKRESKSTDGTQTGHRFFKY